MSIRDNSQYGQIFTLQERIPKMADDRTDAAPIDAFQLHPRPADDRSSTGLAFWAPFALVSMTALALLTQLAAT